MQEATRLPLPVRLMNSSVGALRGIGLPLLPLDPEALLRKASGAAGLEDFALRIQRTAPRVWNPSERRNQKRNETDRLAAVFALLMIMHDQEAYHKTLSSSRLRWVQPADRAVEAAQVLP